MAATAAMVFTGLLLTPSAQAADQYAWQRTLQTSTTHQSDTGSTANSPQWLSAPLSPAVYQRLQHPNGQDMAVLDANGQAVPAAVYQPQQQLLAAASQTQLSRQHQANAIMLNAEQTITATNLTISWLPLTTDSRVQLEALNSNQRWQALALPLRLPAGKQQTSATLNFKTTAVQKLRLRLLNGAPPKLSSAALTSSSQWQATQPQWLRQSPQSCGDRQHCFDLGGYYPVDRWQLLFPVSNAVFGIKLFSRGTDQQAWQWRWAGEVTGTQYGQVSDQAATPAMLHSQIRQLSAQGHRYWKVETISGYAQPELNVGYVPEHIVFQGNPSQPWVLAYGSHAASGLQAHLQGYFDAHLAGNLQPLHLGQEQERAGSIALAQAPITADRTPWTLISFSLICSALIVLAWLGWSRRTRKHRIGATAATPA